jgi:hypothetical protein
MTHIFNQIALGQRAWGQRRHIYMFVHQINAHQLSLFHINFYGMTDIHHSQRGTFLYLCERAESKMNHALLAFLTAFQIYELSCEYFMYNTFTKSHQSRGNIFTNLRIQKNDIYAFITFSCHLKKLSHWLYAALQKISPDCFMHTLMGNSFIKQTFIEDNKVLF